jgi:putative Mg2+ transporter-C (MgtC) family protein
VPLNPTWQDIAVRIALAFVAGIIIGFNRGGRNEAAGMRTTLLVCLAACLVMVLANVMLGTSGKEQKSFAQIDVLRLPLGILSGMGFLGAGAIIKKDDIALGVTTAATLWFMTVVGLCFGAGRLDLGAAGIGVAVVVLWGLKWADDHMNRKFHGSLVVRAERQGLSEAELRRIIEASRHSIVSWAVTYEDGAARYEARAMLQWQGGRNDRARQPPFLEQLVDRPAVLKAAWDPQALSA